MSLKVLATVEGSHVRELLIKREIGGLQVDESIEIISLIPCHIFLELFRCN